MKRALLLFILLGLSGCYVVPVSSHPGYYNHRYQYHYIGPPVYYHPVNRYPLRYQRKYHRRVYKQYPLRHYPRTQRHHPRRRR